MHRQLIPNGILYRVRSDRILVATILRLKRDPQTWRQRAKC